MRRCMIVAVGLLVLASACRDATAPPAVFTAPTAARYQLTQANTLDSEIRALIKALFPSGLETAATSRWEGVASKVASGQLSVAKNRLTELAVWVMSKKPQMDPPPANESIDGATARLLLYMSLYVHSGPNTPVPPMAAGSDADVEVVSPGSPTLLQTPLEHAAAAFNGTEVTQPTIVVVTQLTNFYQQKCSGPFTTKYCQYPLYYHFQSFPAQRFQTPVRMAVCHVHSGDPYGPLPGVDHDGLVLAHDKPANAADYTPGGFPVPGEGIELLPRNPHYDPTNPIVSCHGTVYPQVALFNVPARPSGLLGHSRALAARVGNATMGALGRAISPRSAYAIDAGEEHNTMLWSYFVNVDTAGHPDIQVAGSALSASSVTAGNTVTLNYSVSNGGTSPSPQVNTLIRLTPTGSTPGLPVNLVPVPAISWNGPLFPEESNGGSATVTIPAASAGGTYTLSAVASTAGGKIELGATLGDNEQPVALTVIPLLSDLVTSVSSSRAYAGAGEDIVVTWSVTNSGANPAAASTARIAIESATDAALLDVSVAVPALAAGATTGPQTTTLRVPERPRENDFIRVTADRANLVPESNEGNNTSSTALAIGYPGVDGVMAAGEYSESGCQPMTVNLPEGGTSPGLLCFRNDATNFYAALKFARTADPGGTMTIDIDKDGNGLRSVGDDAYVADKATHSLLDQVRTATSAVLDVTAGGTTNGAHAWGYNGSHVVIEMVHALSSGETQDMAITAGSPVRVRVLLRLTSPSKESSKPSNSYMVINTTP